MALEVAHNTISGKIKLTIVAKAQFSTRRGVSDILQSVAANVRAILADPQGKPLVRLPPLLEGGNPKDGAGALGAELFVWDQKTVIMRKEIAGLAQVNEDDINADSSILKLGLDSIEAIKLSSRLRQHGILLSVSTIMRNTTIRKMCKAATAAAAPRSGIRPLHSSGDGGAVERVLVEFERVVRQHLVARGLQDAEAVYPTTPLQEAMIAETLASGYTLYFNHDVLELERWVDLDRLRSAWEDVVDSNPILRTSFISLEETGIGHTYAQIVQRSADRHHHRHNHHWNEVEVPAAQDSVRRTIDSTMESAQRRANLLGQPPVYISVVKAPHSAHLVLSISHALYDGWSIGLLHRDLRLAYYNPNAPHPPRPSPRLLIENMLSGDAGESKRFWSQLLGGVVPSQFPTVATSESAITANPTKTHRAELISSSVPYREIQAFCKQAGVTLQSLGQACWALLLAHHLGETDVVFGAVLSGRDFDGADEVMFPAMNTLPVRAVLHGRRPRSYHSYHKLLAHLQENGSKTLMYQHTPLRDIQKLVNTGGIRLFDTIFLYQRSQESPGGEDRQLYRSVGGTADIEVRFMGGCIHCSAAKK